MPFIEHDLKTLLADMPHAFLQSEVKTLMLQILSAVAHCHSNWIVRYLRNHLAYVMTSDTGAAPP